MNQQFLNHYYQQPEESILMEIANLAKKSTDLIDLSIGDPDLITDESIIQSAFEDVKRGHTKYTAPDGSAEFIEAVIQFYKKTYGLTFNPDQVRGTVGALHGMYLALQVLLNTGDEVIIHEPYFSPYKEQVIAAGGTPVIIPTYEKDGFQIDTDILEKAITPKTKALILNTPNNPTGAVFSKETSEKIVALAKKYHFYILSDEVYEAFTFYDTFTPLASLAPEHSITFGSFSKAFAMTGWRIGYMIAPNYINEAVSLLNENVTYSAPTPSQRAGIYALEHSEELIPKVVDVFKERMEYIADRVAAIDYLSLHELKGSIYAFINISRTGMTSVAFSKYLLEKTKVLVIPGKAFGDSGDDYVRLAATQETAVLKEAFDRMEKLAF
ncbi:pyridoxal phosphate-dependent aminotransferase [Vagococcus elongatus]|uniref:Aminotransferase n=1 Tax=Vagococcus elongatus TaxID=180344 RepID=A0A430AZW4_9ENTE|nr:pyridoxal phosphate-dependent aminotransferase [Vagococcus elongatus]RSU13542.1 aspartate aminotransferase [Vagococcus elongatus]